MLMMFSLIIILFMLLMLFAGSDCVRGSWSSVTMGGDGGRVYDKTGMDRRT